MKKSHIKKTLFFCFLSIFLVGCKDAVKEVFEQNEYMSQDFLENFYSYYPSVLKDSRFDDNEVIKEIELTEEMSFSLFDSSQNESKSKEYAVLRDYELGLISKKEMKEYFNIDLDKYTVEEVRNDTKIKTTWFDYAKYYNLTNGKYGNRNINRDFERGYFSKMTDGQIDCAGYGSIARVQTREEGFGTLFNYELIDYSSIFVALRGATNIEGTSVKTSSIDLFLSFYIEPSASQTHKKITFKMEVPKLHTDNGSSYINIINFYLEDVLPKEELSILKRATGVSFSYELKNHDTLAPGGVKDPSRPEEFGVMFYELMLPHSSWR